MKKIKKILLTALIAFCSAYVITVGTRAFQIRKISAVPALSYSDLKIF